MSGRQEIKTLTSFRGMAAMLVVLYHFRTEFGTAFAWDRYTHLFQLGWMWVDFFFMLSGFVMAYVYGTMFSERVDKGNYIEFIVRRLGRVYPLHVFMLVCFIPTEFAKYWITSNADPAFANNTPASIATNLLLIHSWHLHASNTWDQPSWSISAEFAAYLVFPFLAAWLLRSRVRTLAVTGCVFFILLVLLKATLGKGTLNTSFEWGVLRCLPTFSIGMVLYRLHAAPDSPFKRVIGSDFALAAAMLGLLLMMHVGANEILLLGAFALVILSGSLASGKVARFFSMWPFHTLGVLSYSIYLTHSLLLRVWQFLFGRFFQAGMSTPVAYLILLVILMMVIGVSRLTFLYVESPGRRLINAYAERWHSRSRPLAATGRMVRY